MAGTEGQRSVLVLSDGADTSDTALDEVTKAVTDCRGPARRGRARAEGRAKAALEELADAGEGRVIDADPEALRAGLHRGGRRAGPTGAGHRGAARVGDRRRGLGLGVAAHRRTRLWSPTRSRPSAPTPPRASAPTSTAPATAEPGMVIPETWMYGGLAGGRPRAARPARTCCIPKPAAALTAGEVASTYTQRSTGRGRACARRRSPSRPLAQATDAATKVLQRNNGLEARIAARLEGAGNPLKPAEWLLLHAGVFVGAGVVGLLLGQGSIVVGLLFLLGGAVVPWVYLGFKRKRRRKAFNASLPDTLQLMSGSLSAGLSLAQSVDTVVREGTEPISSRVQAGADRDPARRRARGRPRGRRRALREQGLRTGSSWRSTSSARSAATSPSCSTPWRPPCASASTCAARSPRSRPRASSPRGCSAGCHRRSWSTCCSTNRDYVMPMFTEPLGWLMLGGAGCPARRRRLLDEPLVKVEV